MIKPEHQARTFFFEDSPVGYFERGQLPPAAERYRYVPYRSFGHYRLIGALKSVGPQCCHYVIAGSKYYFTVQDWVSYGLLELTGFVLRGRRGPDNSGGNSAGCPSCYNAGMTLVEITYELQLPLTEEQLRHLGQFANTYGLRSFRVDESKKQLSFEYDASRLRETQVAHVLGHAGIAAARLVN
jgi:hypothetical protein